MAATIEFPNRDVAEIYNEILAHNQGSRGEKRIPESDTFRKNIANTLAISKERTEQYLQVLRSANIIFIFDIAKADPSRKIEALEGYIVASKDILDDLFPEYEKRLHKAYEHQYKNDKSIDAILKELLPQMNSLNNSSLGSLVNAVSMMREFMYYLDHHAEQYEDDIRSQLLYNEMEAQRLIKTDDDDDDDDEDKTDMSSGPMGGSADLEQPVLQPGDAVTPEWKASPSVAGEQDGVDEEYDDMNFGGNWQLNRIKLNFEKAVKIYGLGFIVRYHFKKNQFKLVEDLVNEKKYFDLSELKLIRDHLKEIMDQMDKDTKLALYKSDIFRLDRTLAKAIRKYMISM